LFAIPWHNCILVGTTETAVTDYPLDPIPQEKEIDFLLAHAARYLSKDPTHSDVLSAFAGLRPLVKSGEEKNTAAVSRDHTINISRCGLITITGGKWTTYRKMAEETIDHAVDLAHLDPEPSVTQELQIHGYHNHSDEFGDLQIYGSDATTIKALLREDKSFKELLHPNFSTVAGEVIWSVRNEMARTVEDFLSRRTRLLLFDAKASIEIAPVVAKLIAKELNKNRNWIKSQINNFHIIADKYLIN
jgi:glycerol-3-phosphate dehydrogenase